MMLVYANLCWFMFVSYVYHTFAERLCPTDAGRRVPTQPSPPAAATGELRPLRAEPLARVMSYHTRSCM